MGVWLGRHSVGREMVRCGKLQGNRKLACDSLKGQSEFRKEAWKWGVPAGGTEGQSRWGSQVKWVRYG